MLIIAAAIFCRSLFIFSIIAINRGLLQFNNAILRTAFKNPGAAAIGNGLAQFFGLSDSYPGKVIHPEAG